MKPGDKVRVVVAGQCRGWEGVVRERRPCVDGGENIVVDFPGSPWVAFGEEELELVGAESQTKMSALAFGDLVHLAADSARESIESGQSGVRGAVACVLNCTGRWATFPEVPRHLLDLGNQVLMGHREDWRGVVAAVLRAEGLAFELPSLPAWWHLV